FYDADNLEALLDHYLGNEPERLAVAIAGQATNAPFTFEALWQRQYETIERHWPAIQERHRQRNALSSEQLTLLRLWQELGACDGGDSAFLSDLTARAVEPGAPAWLVAGLGVLRALQGRTSEGRYRAADLEPLCALFEHGALADPVAELSLLEVL